MDRQTITSSSFRALVLMTSALSALFIASPARAVNECGNPAGNISCSGNFPNGIAYTSARTMNFTAGTVNVVGAPVTGAFAMGVGVNSVGAVDTQATATTMNIFPAVTITTQQDNTIGVLLRGTTTGTSLGINSQATVETFGANSYGVWLETSNGGFARNLINSTITTHGTGAHALFAENNGLNSTNSVSATNGGGTVITNGDGAYGIYALNSADNTSGQVLAENQKALETHGVNAHAVFARKTGTGSGRTSAMNTFTGSTIRTFDDGSHALYALQENTLSTGITEASSLRTIQTDGDNAHTVFAQSAGDNQTNVTIQGTATTLGDGSYAAYGLNTNTTTAKNTQVILGNSTVSTQGLNAHAVRATGNVLSVSLGSTSTVANITTTGDNAFGFLAETLAGGNSGQINTFFYGSSITTSGTNADGIVMNQLFAGSSRFIFLDMLNATLTTTGLNAGGIMAQNDAAGSESFIRLRNSTITTAANNAVGISVTNPTAAPTFNQGVLLSNNSRVETTGTGSQAVFINAGNAALEVGIGASAISNAANTDAIHIEAPATGGEVFADIYGTVRSRGDGAHGITISDTDNVTLTVREGGLVEANGRGSSAIRSGTKTATQAVNVNSSALVQATGEFGVGAMVYTESNAPIFLNTVAGSTILGGWQATVAGTLLGTPSAAIMMGGNGGTLNFTHTGVVSAGSDRVIADMGIYGFFTAPWNIINLGTLTGFVTLGDSDDMFSNRSSNSYNLRHFADTDGDGVRDTERVAISDFGAGNDTFENTSTGTFRLLEVENPATVDDTDAYVPVGLNPVYYDMNSSGIENGQMLNLELFTNAGVIDLQDASAPRGIPGDVLVISASGTAGVDGGGVYRSEGGSLRLDTVLNEGGPTNSISDILVVDSTETGAAPTLLSIRNVSLLPGVPTVGDGIKVVDVLNPAASSPTAFTKGLQRLLSGINEYNLFFGGNAAEGGDPLDGDWYLRHGGLSPTVEVYAEYPGTMARLGKDIIGTLHQRIGERLLTGQIVGSSPLGLQESPEETYINTPQAFRDGLEAASWILGDSKEPFGASLRGHEIDSTRRLFAFTAEDYIFDGQIIGRSGHYNSKQGPGYDQDAAYLRFNIDHILHQSPGGKWLGGLIATVGKTNSDIDGNFAEVETKSAGVGATLTWMNNDGLYIDAVGHYSHFSSEIDADEAGLGLLSENDGNGYALSLETGTHMHLTEALALVPQAQLIYSHSSFDPIFDSTNASVRIDEGESLEGRLSLMFKHTTLWDEPNGEKRGFEKNISLDLTHEFDGEIMVENTGLTRTYDPYRTWVALNVGGTYVMREKIGMYAEAKYNTAIDDFNDSYEVSGFIGVRMKF